jgi:hypothetical protein
VADARPASVFGPRPPRIRFWPAPAPHPFLARARTQIRLGGLCPQKDFRTLGHGPSFPEPFLDGA